MTAPEHAVCAIAPHGHRHTSRAAAQRAADAVNDRNRTGRPLTVYRCECGCNGWSITSKAARTRAHRARAHWRRRHQVAP